jgi:hypothetical protein
MFGRVLEHQEFGGCPSEADTLERLLEPLLHSALSVCKPSRWSNASAPPFHSFMLTGYGCLMMSTPTSTTLLVPRFSAQWVTSRDSVMASPGLYSRA